MWQQSTRLELQQLSESSRLLSVVDDEWSSLESLDGSVKEQMTAAGRDRERDTLVGLELLQGLSMRMAKKLAVTEARLCHQSTRLQMQHVSDSTSLLSLQTMALRVAVTEARSQHQSANLGLQQLSDSTRILSVVDHVWTSLEALGGSIREQVSAIRSDRSRDALVLKLLQEMFITMVTKVARAEARLPHQCRHLQLQHAWDSARLLSAVDGIWTSFEALQGSLREEMKAAGVHTARGTLNVLELLDEFHKKPDTAWGQLRYNHNMKAAHQD